MLTHGIKCQAGFLPLRKISKIGVFLLLTHCMGSCHMALCINPWGQGLKELAKKC